MADAVARSVDHAAMHPERIFLVTAIGTGIAGYSVATVASYFGDVPASVCGPHVGRRIEPQRSQLGSVVTTLRAGRDRERCRTGRGRRGE